MLPDEPELPGQETTTQPAADDLRGDIMRAFKEDQDDQPAADDPAERGPADDPSASLAGQQARDAQGRFTTKPTQPDASAEASRAAAEAAARSQQPPQAGAQAVVPQAPRAGPPPGWSVASKALYDKLPDAIKADIAKRETEVAAGFAKLAEYKGLDPYVEMARNARTSLPEALQRYVNAEQALETDPVSGTLWLAQRYNVDPVQLMYGLCQMHNIHPLQLVQAMGGDMPPGHQNGQGDPRLQPHQQGDPRTMQQLQAMNERLAYMEQERESAEDQAISSQIGAFAQDPANRFFENVRHHMAHIIRTAPQNAQLTLKDVYDQACWANPEIREVLINERATQHQGVVNGRRASERRAASSLPPGSPVAGGTMRRDEPADSLREEIERAFDEHR